jgi:hypothetical protein
MIKYSSLLSKQDNKWYNLPCQEWMIWLTSRIFGGLNLLDKASFLMMH